jgi:riboflavin kinase / FMN adenylyltransferase
VAESVVEDVSVRYWSDFAELPEAARIVTIGSFDGVHRGHQGLLAQTVERAHDLDAVPMAVTFEPLPAQILRPDKFAGRICSAQEKLARLASSGLAEILTLEFSRDFSEQTPEEFLSRLAQSSGMRELWIGEGFALGRNRSGDVGRITAIGGELGFGVTVVQRLSEDDAVISSSAIRSAIMGGDAETAWRYLGRPFRVSGPVIHGAHLGRTIGYPTANVAPPSDLVSLADGIYVSLATLPERDAPWPSMTYVGTRPTVNSGMRLVETHVLDYDGDLYGKVIQVDMLKHLRGDATFSGIDPLIAQLKLDEEATRAFFADRLAVASAGQAEVRHD